MNLGYIAKGIRLSSIRSFGGDFINKILNCTYPCTLCPCTFSNLNHTRRTWVLVLQNLSYVVTFVKRLFPNFILCFIEVSVNIAW